MMQKIKPKTIHYWFYKGIYGCKIKWSIKDKGCTSYSYNNIVRIHRVYCKSVSEPDKKFNIDDTQSHHLIKALRLKEEDLIEVFDGNGNSGICKIVELSNKKCKAFRVDDIKKDKPPKRKLTAVIPFIKRSNFNFMIQKLTEIGVNNFIIYKSDLSDQSIVKKDLGKILEKIEEITISVCKQCGNNFLPSVSNCSSLEDAIRQIDSDNKIYIFDTEASDYFVQEELGDSSSVTVITGPESGFSKYELEIITNNKDVKKRYLGKNILRSETAPIVVSSIIRNHFGRI